MGLKEAGVKLLAEGSDGFLGDMQKATGAVSGFGKEGEKSSGLLKGLGDVLGNVAKVAAGAVVAGFGAMTAALGFSIKEALDAQQIDAQLAAVLKSTGGAAGVTAEMANELATSLSGMTRYEDDAIIAGESMLLTFTNIGKDAFPLATQAMLDLSTAMGTDLQSSAIQLGKALNDPTKGMTALTRVGVTFSKEQSDLIKKLQASGDMFGAQKVILDELAKEFGGSATAAGKTFAGQLDILRNRLGNVAEGVGLKLLPVLNNLVEKVIVPAIPIIETLGEGFGKFIESLAGGGGIEKSISFLADAFTQLFGLDVGLKVMSIGTAFSNLIGFVQSVSSEFIRLVGIFSDVGWQNFFVTFEDGSSWVGSFLETLGMGEEQASMFGGAINTIVQFLGTNLPIAFQFLSDVWTTILQPALLALWTWLQVNVPTAITTLVGIWTNNLAPIFVALAGLWTTTLQPALAALWGWLAAQLPGAIQIATDYWNNYLYPSMQTISAWIVSTLIPTIGEIVTWLAANIPPAIQAASDFFNTTLLPAITAIWSFVQTSLIPIFTQAQTWLATNLPIAIQTLTDFWTNTLLPAITAVWAYVNKNLIPLFTALGDLFNVTLSLAITALTGLFEKTFIPTLNNAWAFVNDNLIPIFKDIAYVLSVTVGPTIQGLVDGAIGALGQAFNDISSAIQDAIKWVEDLADQLSKINLPGWMTPGSPTPWEIGLRGVTSAFKQLNGAPMLTFETNLKTIGKLGVDTTDLTNALTPAPVSPVASASQISNIQNNSRVLNVNFTGNYASTPSVRDSNDLAYVLGLAA